MTAEPPITLQDRFRGCLLGGAVGDAMGAPVEFLSLAEIRARFGESGIREFASAYGRVGAITDDTQMTLFTAEGLLRAAVRHANKGICHAPSVVHGAYLRWLVTQGQAPRCRVPMDGWLIDVKPLWDQRAPGTTCLAALRMATRLGEPARNDSKGCGTVMRTAPIGLVASPDRVFEIAAEAAALTHGHPTAQLAAGFISSVIASLVAGISVAAAIEQGKQSLLAYPRHEELLTAIEHAQSLAAADRSPESGVEQLGGGWVAEEAVAIALYCALVARSFEECIALAVNHSGDSDSTGAIAGNIVGTRDGIQAIPGDWLENLELRAEITRVADDLLGVREGTLDLEDEQTWRRYPGW